MGNADSKPGIEDGESTVITEIASKRSKESHYTEYTSYDGNDTVDVDAVDDSPENRDAVKIAGRNGSNGNSSNNTRDDDLGLQMEALTLPMKKMSDDQVNVNMPMADLMAYLQVVANNSNNLPLTRRDDPELDRTVSTLSAEDYAQKSAAFIPADVRVIGGVFTRYGRVWDLPTTQEYNACDGAQEPGRSYGGACCNTMLKVLYDAANEMDGAAQTEAATKSLFEDDDDEDEEASTVMGKSFRSGFSLDFTGPASQQNITWARVLRQMKSEFKDVGYAQYPKITTTRKIDLNKPFSLQPETFDSKKNKRRSLLIGCNYSAIEDADLKASHDDIRSMKDYIVNVHGFSESQDDMLILMDEDGYMTPTFTNIIEAFKKLSEESQPGDAVFVQFSGHGGRVLDASNDSEAESYDEVLVPVDYQQAGLIRDTLIFKTLLAPMRYGVTVTVMIDCCDTGMVLELPYAWSTKSEKKDVIAKLTTNDDFSYVRFLKVVKTLYESSTFTQLGKTVGSALNPLAPPPLPVTADEMQSRKSKKNSHKKKDKSKSKGANSDSFFEAMTDVCAVGQRKDALQSKRDNGTTNEALQRKDTLFEQMIKGCSLLAAPEDDFSDEDTYKTRTEDESYYSGHGGSFDTMTDDEYESRSRRRRRR